MPASPSSVFQRLRRGRLVQRLLLAVIVGCVRIVAALPSRWVVTLADGIAWICAAGSGRSRRVAYQNLRAVFGEDFPASECRRIFHASWRSLARSGLLLAHLHPLSAEKYRRWVDVDPDLERRPATRRLVEEGGLLVSGHIGNWEFLLALRVLYPHLPPTMFVAEAVPHELVNEALRKLRSHADLQSALRRGGARAVARAVAAGGIAGLLVDRNVRRNQGGVYAPFLGLPARTTPLPAWAALRYDKPIHPIFCLPTAGGRYRIECGEDLTLGIDAVPVGEREAELVRRINATLEAHIRRDPTLWQWRIKRFKSRPTADRGRYPAYSEHDPD